MCYCAVRSKHVNHVMFSQSYATLSHSNVLTYVVRKQTVITMNKYSKNAKRKIGMVMHEFKEGKLHSSAGDKVTDRKQAITIAISEAREEGFRVPAE